MATWIHGEDTALAVDDSYFPVVFATWKGSADPTVAKALTEFLETQLERAAASFDAVGMHLRASLCRARQAELSGDESRLGAALADISGRGIAAPRAWLDAFAPGLSPAER